MLNKYILVGDTQVCPAHYISDYSTIYEITHSSTPVLETTIICLLTMRLLLQEKYTDAIFNKSGEETISIMWYIMNCPVLIAHLVQ